MPRQSTIEKARKDARAGKAPSTQAGEFVREEIDEIRAGKHGVRNTKQAIAIGLSKARKAGVDLPPPPGEKKTARKARPSKTAKRKVSAASSARRSKASLKALKKEPTSPVSRKNLSKQAKSVAAKKSPAKRSAAAMKAAQTRRQTAQSRRVLAG